MTAFVVKLIALIAMIIDHINQILPWRTVFFYSKGQDTIPIIYNGISLIGRMAFPLYAFLISEGCQNTKNIVKYIFRLFIFMLISEIFWITAFHYGLANYLGYSGFSMITYAVEQMLKFRFYNIFATLFVAVSLIYIHQLLSKVKMNRILYVIISVFIVLFMMFLAEFLHTEYGARGIILIFMLYLFSNKKYKMGIIIIWSFGIYSLETAYYNGFQYLSWDKFIFACLSIIPILLYNGKRGKNMKWIFYISYPLHLLILIIIREFMM
jgi:hypothetical protein